MKQTSTSLGKSFLRLLVLLCMIIPTGWLSAQVSTNYVFNQHQGTYTPIAGGTVLYTGESAAATYSLNFATVAPGLFPANNFNFNGGSYASLTVYTNGYVAFGATLPTTATATPISTAPTSLFQIAAPFAVAQTGWMAASGATGEIRHQVVGGDLVIQWSNMKPAGVGTYNPASMNYQIRLNGNGSTIRFVYGDMRSNRGATTTTAQIGLRGGASNVATGYNNRNATTTWYGTTAGLANTNTVVLNTSADNPIAPRAGLTYTYSYGAPAPVCSGAPALGNAQAYEARVFPGRNVHVTVDGANIGTGLSYQLQSSPDNSTWTNVGATNTFGGFITAMPALPAAGTYYRVQASCSAGPLQSSGSVFITAEDAWVSQPYQGATSMADEELTAFSFGTAGSIINNTSGCTSQAAGAKSYRSTYNNYRGVLPTNNATLGVPIPFSFTYNSFFGNCAAGGLWTKTVKIWVDLNRNGSFLDAGETVYVPAVAFAGAPTPNTVTGNITLPISATPGITSLRISVNETSTLGFSPHGTFTWGETEDYLINMVAPAICGGIPPGSNAQTSATAGCTGQAVNLTLDNAYALADYTFQWQTGPTAGGPWTNFGALQTSAPLATTITATQFYRCVITCTNGGASTNSGAVQVTLNPFYNCYCTSGSATNTFDEDILNVTIAAAGLNQTSTCATVGPLNSIQNRYTNYTGSPATTLQKTTGYPMTIQVGTCGSTYAGAYRVYVDMDQNGIFAASEILASGNTGTTAGGWVAPLTYSTTLSIPGTATNGLTGMRVQWYETGFSPPTDNQGCTSFGYGETEDYLVNITPPPACAGTPASNTLSTSGASVCPGNPFTLSLSTFYSGTGITYDWQYSTTGIGGPYLSFGVGNGSSTFVVNSQTVASHYRCEITCSTGPTSVISTPVAVGQNAQFACYCPQLAGFTGWGDITNVTVGTINNNSACGALAPGAGSVADLYSNFQAVQTDITKTVNNAMSVTVTNCSSGSYAYMVKVWIDYNQNTVFEAGELIYTSGTPSVAFGTPVAYNFNFTAPLSAVDGQTLMRVYAYEAPFLASEVTACNSDVDHVDSWGEVEDYIVNLVSPPACTGTPAGGALPGSLSVLTGTSAILAPTGYEVGTGIVYTWQESNDNGVGDPWAPVVGGSGAATEVYTTPALGATIWYRLSTFCANSGQTNTSNSVQITVTGGATCAVPYVVPALPFQVNFSANGAGNDIGVQASCGGTYGGGEDVIFEFTAPAAGNYEVSVANLSNTRLIGWFLKSTCNSTTALTTVACDVSTAAHNSAHGIAAIPSAGTYYVVVDYAAPITQSNFFIQIRQVPAAPAYDVCTSAQSVTMAANGTCSSPAAGTLAGTTSSGLAGYCGGANARDAWFSFTAVNEAARIEVSPATNGITATGSNLGFEVYEGTCAGLTSLGCINGSSVRGAVESGLGTGFVVAQTYYVRVYDVDGGYGSANGSFTLCVTTPNPPANDNCVDAVNLALGATCAPVAGVTVSATQSLAASACSGFTGNADDDIWYSFTVTGVVPVNVSCEVAATGFFMDPVVQLYSGSCGSLTTVVCADQSLQGGVERINATLAPGTYFVRVYHYGTGSGGGGAHTICVTTTPFVASPANNNTCNAFDLPVGTSCSPDGPYTSNTGTRTLNYPAGQVGGVNDDVWFKATVPLGVTSLTLNVQGGGGYDPVIQAFVMSNCKTITGFFPAVDQTLANGTENQILFGLTGGSVIYFRVYDFATANPSASANFTVCAYQTPAPPNDAFVNAELIYQQNSATCFAPVDGYTVGATGGEVAAAPCTGNPDDDVWYSFIATNTTATIVVTGFQGFDPAVNMRNNVLPGTSLYCANATAADGTETINATGLTPGATYKIRVYSPGTGSLTTGTFTICVFGAAAPPPNDNCAGAIGLPNTSPCTPIAGILTGATQQFAPSACSTGFGTITSPAAYEVWYSFIASNSQATITGVGTNGSDVVVQMYSGACGSLTPLGCNDADPVPNTENLVVTGLTPGQLYYTRIYVSSATVPGSLGGADPNFTMCFTGQPPVNDNICGATNINVASGRTDIVTSNLGATNSLDPLPTGWFTTWNNDVWYRCTVPSNGVVAINVLPIGFNDTRLRVYSSSNNLCSGTLSVIAHDDDGGGGTSGFGSFIYLSGQTPGNTLFFVVDGFSAANFGQFRLNVNDGWLWTGTGGFTYNGATNWINQEGGAYTTPEPSVAVLNGGSTGWSTTPASTIINIPPVTNQPIYTSNASIGGVKFVGGVFTQSKITVNSGVTLTLTGTPFAGTGRGITGVAAGGRFEGAGRLDIGAAVSGQLVTVNYPTRFRLATTVLGTANVQSNGNMIFDNGASLYSGQAGPNSQVNGNITYRRQGNTSQIVYNFWSAPITNGVLSSLAAPGYIPNLYQYNTANATGLDYLGTQAGWDPLTPATAMVAGKGYIATGAGLANFTGLPQQNAVTVAATPGSGGNNFNLIGNPYPAPVSANSFLTANAARINAGAMYIWDDDASGGTNYAAGDFITYSGLGVVNGPNSGLPFSGNIASCQGFFVNYVASSGDFSFTNAMKVYGTNSEFFDATTATRMRVRMENVNAVASETIIAFLEDATDAADQAYDAVRLAGNADMGLYTFNGDMQYSIQAWPTLNAERVIDLGTVNTANGPSTISINMFENFDPTVVVYLEDTELGVFHNLTQLPTYSFNNTGLDGNDVRFRLHFRAPIAVASSMDCSGTESGKIIIANPNVTPVSLELKNANNEVVATAAPFVGEHEVSNLAAGNYVLNMVYNGGGLVTRNAVIETNGMTAPASFIASATTVSIADAIIEFQGTAQGASEYIWDFGDGTIVTGDLNPVHAYTSLGVYTVTFTALNNGCGSTATSTVSVTNDATGIGSATTNNGFSIFPNPATDVANLLLNVDRSESEVTISINDAAGRLVSTKLVNDVRSGAVIGLDINGLANGVYQVSVEGKNFRNVGRLTIAK